MRFLLKIVIMVGLMIVSVATIFLARIPYAYAQEIDATTFTFSYEGKMWIFRARDFELDSNIFSLNFRISKHKRNGTKEEKIQLLNKLIDAKIDNEIAFNYIYFGFNKKINNIKKNIEKNPQNAEIKVKNNKLNIKNEIIGIKLNKYLFYEKLIDLYVNNLEINFEIPVIKSESQVLSKDLRKDTFKRAEFSTNISSSSSARKHNIKKALNAINGTKIQKREQFSFNKTVGRRTSQNGYKEAKIILDGEFVDGVGGGVCQVSTTLYNAVLRAGLNVVRAHKHSQPVSYIKSGFDAMVNYGSADLVVENNTEGDIYILCNYTPNQITITIYGRDLCGVNYKTENEIIDKVSAGENEIIYDTNGEYLDKVIYDDEKYILKRARDGYTVKSYRLKYYNSELIEKELLRTDKYMPQKGKVVYGVQKRPTSEQVENLFTLSREIS